MIFFLFWDTSLFQALMVPSFGRPMQLLKVRLIGLEGWLYACVMAFRHIDSAVMSVGAVKS